MAKKVLFINQEITPYVPESEMSTMGSLMPHKMQDAGFEIRTFMPKWGTINERRGQLHEGIRLSGMNLIIDDTDHPLIIKVASIPQSRIQVYFIDNEDYFRRRQIYHDEDGQFFPDNGERAIFFARGVLETVKKLRWAPDIIHCSGWISHVLPLYLKKAYREDPIFSQSKLVLSLFEDTPTEPLSPTFAGMLPFGAIKAKDISLDKEASGIELAKLAVQYSDGVILGSPDVDPSLVAYCKESGLPLLGYEAETFADGTYMDHYNAFYDKLLSQ